MAARGGRVVAAALLLATAACTSSHRQAGTRVLPTAAPTTTVAAPATTAAPAPTTAPAAAIPGGCPSGMGVAAQGAVQAARCLYEAWKADDRAAAAVFASLDVVDALLAARWTPPDATFKGCAADTSTGGDTCRFDYHGAALQFDAERSEGGWRVTALSGLPRG